MQRTTQAPPASSGRSRRSQSPQPPRRGRLFTAVLAALALATAFALSPQNRRFDRRLGLDVDLGAIQIHLYGSSVFYLWLTVGILAIAGVAVAASRNPELIRRWATWVAIAVVVGVPLWLGNGATAVLTAALSVVGVIEFARLVQLRRADTAVLMAVGVAFPLAAWLRPDLLANVPVVVLACALPAVIGGDAENGARRAAFTVFGSVWICWSFSLLVVLSAQAYALFFAVALTDVAAWCGGNGLRRFGWARRRLSALSPSKTLGGLAGAVLGALLALALLGTLSFGLLLAVAAGSVLGDLLESMVKRQARVKDASGWLPGFGGLLDRVDSLLLVLPLALLLG